MCEREPLEPRDGLGAVERLHELEFARRDQTAAVQRVEALKQHAPIHMAILPVNEFNFFRSREGIVGNMSVREAFGLASEIGADRVVPVH